MRVEAVVQVFHGLFCVLLQLLVAAINLSLSFYCKFYCKSHCSCDPSITAYTENRNIGWRKKAAIYHARNAVTGSTEIDQNSIPFFS